jgi:O-antigen ligase
VESHLQARLETSAKTHYAIPLAVGVWAALIALMPTTTGKLVLAAPVILIPILWWAALNAQTWLYLFFFAVILLPPLPIALGGSGPHPALLIVPLGLMAGILRAHKWRPCGGALPFLIVGFVAVLMESVLFAAMYSGGLIAIGSLVRVFLFAIGPYVFFYTLCGPGHERTEPLQFARFLFLIGTLAALFACIDFYFQLPAPAGFGPQYVWLEQEVLRRAQGLFYEASTLGNFCAFFLVMIVVALFHPRDQVPCSRLVLIAGGVIFSAALIFSYSRASLLNVAVAVCALACLLGSKFRRAVTGLTVSLVIGGAIVYFALPTFGQSYLLRLFNSFQYIWSSPNGVLSGRLDSWAVLSDFITQEPLHVLFGVGYKTLPYSSFTGSTVIADNNYLSLLVETGVLGLVVFLFLNFAILRAAWRAARSSSPRAAFFGSWIFCFWTGQIVQMLSGDLITYWRIFPLYFWTLATAIRESAQND